MAITVPLKDLCMIDITDGTHKTPTYSNEGFIFLSSKNVTSGKIDWDNVMYIPEQLHNELYKRISPQKNDILLAKNGTTGVAAIVDRDEVFDIYVSLALIRPDETKVLPRYLLHAINSYPSKQFFDSHLKGIGVPNLHLTHIREVPIKVPSFFEQQYIIDILDKVDNLISLRKQQLAKLDELVKSRFVELFGDPISSCDTRYRLSDIGRIFTGNTPSMKEQSYYDSNDIPFVKPGDIGDSGVTNIANVESFVSENARTVARIMPIGSIVVTCIGTIGKIGIATKECCCNQQINYIVPNMGINSIYLANCLTFFKGVLSDMANAPVVPIINKTQFSALEIPIADLERQERFATFVEQTDKSKLTIQQSLDKLELMKKALMQKYFG